MAPKKKMDFLTAACKAHYKEKFNIRTCPELQSLRTLKDCLISEEEKQIFKEIGPKIAKTISQMPYPKQKLLLTYIFYHTVKKSAHYVENGKYTKAYYVLRNSTCSLAKHLLKTPKPQKSIFKNQAS